MDRQLSRLLIDAASLSERNRYYKMLMRCEPCKTTRVSRRKRKRATSRVQRRLDAQLLKEQCDG